jgi:deferrochelatase/peroxidase EfeB
MSQHDDNSRRTSRRGFLASTAGLVAAVGQGASAQAAPASHRLSDLRNDRHEASRLEPFWGLHQAGIATAPQQTQTYFAAFDLVTVQRSDLVALLRAWTAAAHRLTQGLTAQPLDDGLMPVMVSTKSVASGSGYGAYASNDVKAVGADSMEALGLPASRLSITFGFGPGLFSKDGHDRFGLASKRPEALVDLPKFPGEELVEAHTGGDLSVQACADDPQVAFHAVRQLARIAGDVAQIRWVQAGFMPDFGPGEIPRNLMGFKDGIINVPVGQTQAMDRFVWVGKEGPDWMQGGSYVVARRIRIALEHWDSMKVSFQEQTFGRHKQSGAPLGCKHEFDPLDLKAMDKDGNPVIPENAHARLASPQTNGGAEILRRSYSYNNGANMTAERWPPWRQALEYDAGLLFIAYQRDPRTGFIKIFDKMSRFDMMNQFATHVGSGLFACPPGPAQGEYLGQALIESS